MARDQLRPARMLMLALLMSAANAAPMGINPIQWFDEILHPKPSNGSIQDEIQCYALPYGGFGFLSHILTYYTAACLMAGRKPIWPGSPLRHSVFDMFICFVSMVITIILSSFTISSCRNSWPFLLMAVWKLTLSLSINVVGIASSWALRSGRDGEKSSSSHFDETFWYSILYWLGSIVGLVGVFYVVHQTFGENRNIQIVTGILIAVTCITLLLTLIVLYSDDEFFTGMIVGPTTAAGLALVIGVFYSDWVLAALQNNWSGAPSGDIAYLYWVYFAAKRLPMLAL